MWAKEFLQSPFICIPVMTSTPPPPYLKYFSTNTRAKHIQLISSDDKKKFFSMIKAANLFMKNKLFHQHYLKARWRLAKAGTQVLQDQGVRLL